MAGIEIVKEGIGYTQRTVVMRVPSEPGIHQHELGRVSVRYRGSEDMGDLSLTLAARLRGVFRGKVTIPLTAGGDGTTSREGQQINVYGFSQSKLV